MFKAVHYTLSNIKGTQKKFHIVEAGLFLFCTPLKVQMLLLDCYITRSFILEWFAVIVVLFLNSLCVKQVFIKKDYKCPCFPRPKCGVHLLA